MRTQRTIILLVLAIGVALSGGVLALVTVVGARLAATIALGGAAAASAAYLLLVRPWHTRWGATDVEAGAPMPGDGLCVAHGQTTRAIGIAAPAGQVWPWLVQIGFGRAGWYSYDWIDNDRRPSASTIQPDLQDLAVGDVIAMTPSLGFVVCAMDPGRSIVARTGDGTVWSLQLADALTGGCRLVSRFRSQTPWTPKTALWLALADVGAFIMERKMLLGIKRRAESASKTADDHDAVRSR